MQLCCRELMETVLIAKIQQARDYWSGRLTGELEETLLGGRIRVERILEDYQ